MSSSCSAVCKFAKQWCSTEVQVHETSYAWTINNFEFLEAAKGPDMYSSKFSAVTCKKIKWKLKFNLNGEPKGDEDTMSMFLMICCPAALVVHAKFDFFALDVYQRKVRISKSALKEFRGIENTAWGFEAIKKDYNFRNSVLVNDKLTIICELKFSEGSSIDAISKTSHRCKTTLHSKATVCDLSENLEQLLNNPELADVVLSVYGQEFPAHKNILVARCPVFAAMFKYDMKENEQNRIDIEDMDAETVDEFLRYIYTGKCINLSNVAEPLLIAADKYQINRLKTICAEELSKALSVENAASILALADTYGVKELKDNVIKFIVSNRAGVLETQGWKNIRSNFDLVDDVYLALAER